MLKVSCYFITAYHFLILFSIPQLTVQFTNKFLDYSYELSGAPILSGPLEIRAIKGFCFSETKWFPIISSSKTKKKALEIPR